MQTNSKELGFGFMRLPRNADGIDMEKTIYMVDEFLNAGYSYFDTAYMYNGSEEALNTALVRRYSRDKYRIASKLPLYKVSKEKTMMSIFNESLSRIGIDYIDYYMLHGIDKFWSDKADEMGAWSYLRELKAQGLIRNIGFSFHGSPEDLSDILNEHDYVDFVQLQINYIDWNDSKIQSKALYEIARQHNKPIIVMEPLKGGLLASEDLSSAKLLHGLDNNRSAAAWGMKFVISLEGVFIILSGMNSVKQLHDNVKTFSNQTPLSTTEMKAIDKAIRIINCTPRIACTSCNYCVSNCIKGIKIPILISLYNDCLIYKTTDNSRHMYDMYTEDGTKASTCMKCKKCEERCPQRLRITDILEHISELFDNRGGT